MKQFLKLEKLNSGDQVAVISPSAGLPGLFPWVHELGIERIKNEFKLTTKEYPTTRQMGSSLKHRAADIMAAFSDPKNKAVISTIGGEDQIKLLKYLDPGIIKANPKPFFGYSDCTHLGNYLWNLDIPSYYGGAIMTQFAMQNKMDDLTKEWLRKALFESGEFELDVSTKFNDEGLDWADKSNLNKIRKYEDNPGLIWDGEKDVEGILWGGCVESLLAQFTVGKYLPSIEELTDTILFFETAEDLPEPWIVEYFLIGLGERGWLDKFRAVFVGRPKAWEFDKPNNTEQKKRYKQEQNDAVVKTIRGYNKDIPIVLNLDFGHTDPQIPMPAGQKARLTAEKKIFLSY